MKIIAICGGVASGKNVICEIFKKKGAKIFDADAIVHELLDKNKPLISVILNEFPEAKNYNINTISRSKLGEIVFNSNEKLKILENIIHPYVKEEYKKFIATENQSEMIILNIPLILETNNYSYDYLIAIKASLEIRKNRFIKRFKQNYINNDLLLTYNKSEIADRVDKIVNKQVSDEYRISKADFVIDNNQTIDNLESQINEIIFKLKLN